MDGDPDTELQRARLRHSSARMSVTRTWLLAATLSAGIAPALTAQSRGGGGDGYRFVRPLLTMTVRGGYDRPMARGDVYNLVVDQLTLSRSALAAVGYSADVALRVSNRWDAVLTVGNGWREAPSEFRRFVDNELRPIEQSTRLERRTIALGARYALRAPGEQVGRFAWVPRRFTPWIGAGVGVMPFAFQQNGDFIDFNTRAVFRTNYRATGRPLMAYTSIGSEVGVTAHLALVGDLRYTAARGQLSQQFQNFSGIDLSGAAATMGLALRY
jgi:hypothetical protein